MPGGDSTEEQFPEYDFDPEKLNLRVRVALAADRKAVDPVVEQVMQAVREMKCVNGKEDAIELALQEALANAVVHGAKEDPNKIVECLVACDEERGILIIVRDPGEGFDPKAIPSLHDGRESLLQPRPRNFPDQSVDGRSEVPQERNGDSHGEAVLPAAYPILRRDPQSFHLPIKMAALQSQHFRGAVTLPWFSSSFLRM